MTQTLLDIAAESMNASPSDETVRVRFFGRLTASELLLMLEAEPIGDKVEPKVFNTSDGQFALVFDRDDRLTTFADGPCPYAAVTGRAIIEMLKGEGIGLGLNLGVAPSSQLISAEAVSWLAETLDVYPNQVNDLPGRIDAPGSVPGTLLKSLDARLAQAAGLASHAYLIGATYQARNGTHLLAIINPRPGAEPTLVRAVQDALTFSGLGAGEIDVTFFESQDPIVDRFEKVGLRFDLPEVEIRQGHTAPGLDPEKPPKLR